MRRVTNRNYEELAAALVRQMRGRRSRLGLSQRLGYSTNALYTWETGAAWPSTSRFFEFGEIVGIKSHAILTKFFRDLPARLAGSSLATPAGIQLLLLEFMGRTRIASVANSSGLSRFAITRWLNGKAQPKLPQLLCFVEHSSMRLLDFLDALTDISGLPRLSAEWQALQAARDVGYHLPMSHAVLRALETATYKKGDGRVEHLAAMLGVDTATVTACLTRLVAGKQVAKRLGRWNPTASAFVDFRHDPDAAQQVKAYFASLAAERCKARRPGLFAYNVFAVSREDLVRIETLQREYLRQMRSIIAKSEPTDIVALANFQLFAMQD